MVDTYCRLCAKLTNEYDLVDILGSKNDLENKLKQCFQLKIDEHDVLPKQCCNECSDKVCSFNNYREQLMKAQQFLENTFTHNSNINSLDHKIGNTQTSTFDSIFFNKIERNDYDTDDDNYFSTFFDDSWNADQDEKPTRKGKEYVKKSKRTEKKETDSDVEEMRKSFYYNIDKGELKDKCYIISDENYRRFIKRIEESKVKPKALAKFDVHCDENDVKRLIMARCNTKKTKDSSDCDDDDNENKTLRYFVSKSELFDCIRTAHINCNHGGRIRTEEVLKPKYKNISRKLVQNYINLCKICDKEEDKVKLKKRILRKPLKYKRNKNVASDDDSSLSAKEDKIETPEDVERMKDNFYHRLNEGDLKDKCNIFTDETYARIIKELEEEGAKPKALSIDSRRLDKFEVYINPNNGQKRLIMVRADKTSDPIRYYLPKSELFDVIRTAHLECNHGGRIRTQNVLKPNYKNISRKLIESYIYSCKMCTDRYKYVRDEYSSLDVKEEEPKRPKKLTVENYEWKCRECSQISATARDLEDHYEHIHNKPVEYACIQCSHVSISYLHFRTHLLKHRNQFKYRCDTCFNYFSSGRRLREHRELHNANRKKYFCSQCGKGFFCEISIARHERIMHTNEIREPAIVIKSHKCDVCEKMFASVSMLNYHKKIHTGIREHTCELCGKSFVRKHSLQEHRQRHSTEKPYKCELCPSSFKSKNGLQNHLVLHSGVKPFECDVCGKKFPRMAQLKQHSIRHTNLRPFKCETCNMSFRTKRNLVRHTKLHQKITTKKRYPCLICNRHFTCSPNYEKHMKLKHNMATNSIATANVNVSNPTLITTTNNSSTADIIGIDTSQQSRISVPPSQQQSLVQPVVVAASTTTNYQRTFYYNY